MLRPRDPFDEIFSSVVLRRFGPLSHCFHERIWTVQINFTNFFCPKRLRIRYSRNIFTNRPPKKLHNIWPKRLRLHFWIFIFSGSDLPLEVLSSRALTSYLTIQNSFVLGKKSLLNRSPKWSREPLEVHKIKFQLATFRADLLISFDPKPNFRRGSSPVIVQRFWSFAMPSRMICGCSR